MPLHAGARRGCWYTSRADAVRLGRVRTNRASGPRYTTFDDSFINRRQLAPAQRVSYLVPPPLTERDFKISPAAAAAANKLRSDLPVQAARRMVGRSTDDALLVPSLLSRLHARAAQDPANLDEPEARLVMRDGQGQLLMGRCGACCVVQLVDLPDGRDAIDVFACAVRPSALAYGTLNDVLELLRLCLAEVAPGAQSEHHVIGSAKQGTPPDDVILGLSETIPPPQRPTVPIGTVRAACKAGKATIHFGGSQQSVLQLLGDEEVRSTKQQIALQQSQQQANKALQARKSPPPQPKAQEQQQVSAPTAAQVIAAMRGGPPLPVMTPASAPAEAPAETKAKGKPVKKAAGRKAK